MASLYKESLFEDLLYEDEGLTAERTRIKSLLQAYKEAFSVRSFSLPRARVRLALTAILQTLSEVL